MGALISDVPAMPVAMAELKAFLRLTVTDEDALLAGLVRAAAELCEAFIGRALIERAVEEMAAPSSAPLRLGAGPVRAITAVAAIDDSGAATTLSADDFTAEIDADGTGRVRLRAASDAARLRMSYRVGMAEDWNGVPEMLRHGIVRLAAQYYSQRGPHAEPAGQGEGTLPSAVTALWRPWRKPRLG